MSERGYRKQVLLFLTAVLLPSLVLVVLTLRMVSQEKELAQKRALDEQRRMARDFGQAFLIRLENIKLQEVAEAPDRSGARRARTSSQNAEVVLLSPLLGGQIILPWEDRPDSRRSNRLFGDPAFARRIRQAEREEFERNNDFRAADLYAQILREFQDPAQKAYARLLLARTLVKAKQTARGLGQFQEILKLPFAVSDEYGIPFCLYAARRLLDLGERPDLDLAGLCQEIQEGYWLSPEAAHFLLDLLKDIQSRNGGEALSREAGECLPALESYVRTAQQALALKRNFPNLAIGPGSEFRRTPEGPLWLSYGEKAWLVSTAPSLSRDPSFLIAVDAQKALEALKNDKDFSELFPGRFTFTPESDPRGISLGAGFQGLRLRLPEDLEVRLAKSWSVNPAFYIAALLLVLGVTSAGAYFLWRDVRREVQMAEMRSQFVSSVSHELKTPLTAIRMFAETLRLGRSKDRKAQEEYLDTIVNESQRLTRLLNNVLDFSKLEKGIRAYRPEKTSVPEVVQAAVQAMDYPFKQQGYRLRVQVEDGLPEIVADRDALEQAILNLLHNAMKYSGESREIDLRAKREGRFVLIQVQDQGIGIEPKEQAKIFEKFYRIPSAENKRLPGTGLGLAIVAAFVKAHGGHLRVESTPGAGSTFTLFLPWEESR
jgi:signal transduction histidine kinase